MSSDTSAVDSETICFRMEDGRKREVKMRAAQLGYDSTSDYLRELVTDDLEDVQFVLE